MPDSLQTAFVLHRRDYRDTSQIIELFTLGYGRVSVVAKGAKRAKSPLKTSLQMFQPLLVNWLGKHELMTLTHAELQKPFSAIKGHLLAWAFYLNELLYRLLDKHEAYPHIFQHYQQLLNQISNDNVKQENLRLFEYELLYRLGYGLHLKTDDMGNTLQAEQCYLLDPTQSPSKTHFTEGKNIYLGRSLLDLQQKKFDNTQSLKEIKRLLRQALQPLLGDKPFKSRELLL